MASQQEIDYLFVSRGSDHLIYQRSSGKGPVYLLRGSDGQYSVSLKSGQYGFGSDETGRGDFVLQLVGGGIHDAKVVRTEPANLPENATDAIDIVLFLDI